MRLLYYFICSSIFYVHTQASTEYTYPVAVIGDGTAILYIHQFSSQCIQLFGLDPITNHAEQMLWSLFNPAGLQLLPNDVGFSFIDNGRLRIKLFQKRMPKAIDFDEPIFNINALQWIDEHTCYCSAQQSDHFALFQVHDDGTLCCLLSDNGKNCMYPQKINTDLFYIESCKNGNDQNTNYRIMKTTYLNRPEPEFLIDFYDTPIIFLHMLSQEEGFVIEHEKNIDAHAHTIHFFYHHLIKKGDHWECSVLFSFEIPTYLTLFNNESRLFESILPLLPRMIDNKIYFVDCSKNRNYNLEPYYYDVLTQQKEKILTSGKNEGHCFVPISCGQKLYFGGTRNEKEPILLIS